jgi:hypothetical protein
VVILCGIFFLVLLSGVARNLRADCGCFGAGPEKVWISLGRDIALILSGVVIYKSCLSQDAAPEERAGEIISHKKT